LKRVLFSFWFLFLSFLCFGQLSFEWFNKEKGLLERINFQSGNYETLKVNKDNTFKVQGKLRIDGVNLADIQPNFDVNVFPKGKNRILTVPGTGQVYEFDLSKKSLKRIDKTFYRGYNFKALQFVQNDTLFSVGGTGFWQYHNVLSFFDPSTSEWHVMYPKGNRPEGIYLFTSGISDGRIFALEQLRELDNKDAKRKAQIFEFDIKSKKWSNFGELNIPLLSEYEINSPEFQWSSNHLFFLHAKEPIYADVISNQVYKYNETQRGILSNKGLSYISNGWVYTFRNEHNKFSLDSISYKELQRNSILIGELYTKTPRPFLLFGYGIYSILIIAIMLIGSGIFYIRYRSSMRKKASLSTIVLPKYLDKLLEVYKIKGAEYLISTEELSRIIECDSMAFDTQRQYRSKFISNVNAYASDTFGISNAIFRINHDSDKRFIQYGIKKEFFALIDGIIV
jgi:hypothetical protein